jgi:hypothetical protein
LYRNQKKTLHSNIGNETFKLFIYKYRASKYKERKWYCCFKFTKFPFKTKTRKEEVNKFYSINTFRKESDSEIAPNKDVAIVKSNDNNFIFPNKAEKDTKKR